MSSSVAMVIVATSISDEKALGFNAVDVKIGGLVGSAGVSSTIRGEGALSLREGKRTCAAQSTSWEVLVQPQEVQDSV